MEDRYSGGKVKGVIKPPHAALAFLPGGLSGKNGAVCAFWYTSIFNQRSLPCKATGETEASKALALVPTKDCTKAFLILWSSLKNVNQTPKKHLPKAQSINKGINCW